MNLSNQRKSIQSTLMNASSIIEIAKQEGMTDIELLSAIDLIKNLHQEKATSSSVALQLESKEISHSVFKIKENEPYGVEIGPESFGGIGPAEITLKDIKC